MAKFIAFGVILLLVLSGSLFSAALAEGQETRTITGEQFATSAGVHNLNHSNIAGATYYDRPLILSNASGAGVRALASEGIDYNWTQKGQVDVTAGSALATKSTVATIDYTYGVDTNATRMMGNTFGQLSESVFSPMMLIIVVGLLFFAVGVIRGLT
tara:strand:+ start:1927 stop:2397 length:471 start_codon:yes stop_codon:yes gene_type:complete